VAVSRGRAAIRPGVELPAALVPVAGGTPRPPPGAAGVLFHDLSLLDLIRLAAGASDPPAVEVDTVEGLAPDRAAVEFLARRLGIRIVITRRPALVRPAVEAGCLVLLRVFCLDSTGFERALEGHPGAPAGTAISPGLILAHLGPEERARLPRPLLAYGLIRRRVEVEAALAAGADGVVVEGPMTGWRPAGAARSHLDRPAEPGRK
jgi:glycerol uptake operon antiterminator